MSLPAIGTNVLVQGRRRKRVGETAYDPQARDLSFVSTVVTTNGKGQRIMERLRPSVTFDEGNFEVPLLHIRWTKEIYESIEKIEGNDRINVKDCLRVSSISIPRDRSFADVRSRYSC